MTHPNSALIETDDGFDQLWSNLEAACARHAKGAITPQVKNFPGNIIFGIGGNALPYQLFGWNFPENGFTWTEGREAILEISGPRVPGNYFLNVRLAPLLCATLSQQRVRVCVGTVCVAEWNVIMPGHYFALILGSLLDASDQLTFYLPDAASPLSLGIGLDDRQLALQVYDLSLSLWVTVPF